MKEYRGAQRTKEGTYWSLKTGEFVSIAKEGGILPGEGDRRYVRTPIALVIIAGPMMGLLYLIFLPLLGIVGLASFASQRLAQRVREMAHNARVAREVAAHKRGGVVHKG